MRLWEVLSSLIVRLFLCSAHFLLCVALKQRIFHVEGVLSGFPGKS
jgi:hypothetical protein